MLSVLVKLKNLAIYGRSATLRGYEIACLDAWRANLSAEAAAILDAQLAFPSFVQRLSGDKLVVFHGQPGSAKKLSALFPNVADELVASVVEVGPVGGGTAVGVRIVLHRGRLSSLEFKREPASCGLGSSTEAEVLAVRLIANPMQEPLQQVARVQPLPPPVWSGCLARMSAISQLEDFRAPISPEALRALGNAHLGLPEEYLDILRQSDGLRFGDIIVLGSDGLRNIVLPRVDLCVLAEMGDDCLCVDEVDGSGALVFLRGGEDLVPVALPFCDTLISEFLRRQN